jgi:hypothetical protein
MFVLIVDQDTVAPVSERETSYAHVFSGGHVK